MDNKWSFQVWNAVLKAEQRCVMALGRAGSGKTTLGVDLARHLLASGQSVLFLSANRNLAKIASQQILPGLPQSAGVLEAKTMAALAYSILQREAQLMNRQAPLMLTGAQQDMYLKDLLDGQAQGLGSAVRWPASVSTDVLQLRGFRDELRHMFMQLAELGISGAELEDMAERYEQPLWLAVADLWQEYQGVLALESGFEGGPLRYDPAGIVAESARVLADRAQVRSGVDPARLTETFGLNLDWIIIDDYQEVTRSGVQLLSEIMQLQPGMKVILLADPAQSVLGFRGAQPSFVSASLRSGKALGEFGAKRVVLPGTHRQSPEIADLTAATAHHIPTNLPLPLYEKPEHVAFSPDNSGPIQVLVGDGQADEMQLIANSVRHLQLHGGYDLQDITVIARSTAMASQIQRFLLAQGIASYHAGQPPALAQDPVVSVLLDLVDIATNANVTGEQLLRLLGSPLCFLDAGGLRRLRRAVRHLHGPGTGKTSDELLTATVLELARLSPEHATGHEFAEVLSDVSVAKAVRILRAALELSEQQRQSPASTLWQLWVATDLQDNWQQQALHDDSQAGILAGEYLDALMSLFAVAQDYAQTHDNASATGFAQYLRGQQIAADNLAQRGAVQHQVGVYTPAAAAGRQWPVVIIAGLHENVWPDLRLRNSLLRADLVTDIVQGKYTPNVPIAQAKREVLDDELRMLCSAIARAEQRVVFTTSLDTDTQPSMFFQTLGIVKNISELQDLQLPGSWGQHPPSLRQLAAKLRADLTVGDLNDEEMESVTDKLSVLAGMGLAYAKPENWYGYREKSTDLPILHGEREIRVSASKVESGLECPLRWALGAAGGTQPSGNSQNIGNLVHAVIEDLPLGSYEDLQANFENRWHELGFEDDFVGKQAYGRIQKMLSKLGTHFSKLKGQIDPQVDTEVRVELERTYADIAQKIIVTAVIDRIERYEQGLLIADLKTGKTAITNKEAKENLQLGIYQLALGEQRSDEQVIGAQLIYPGTTTQSVALREQPKLDDTAQAFVEECIAKVAKLMNANSFPAIENQFCNTCEFWALCPIQTPSKQVQP